VELYVKTKVLEEHDASIFCPEDFPAKFWYLSTSTHGVVTEKTNIYEIYIVTKY
jgi:hypothetical protein